MKFYSYEYVLSQLSSANWVLAGIILLILVAVAFVAFQYYHEKRDSKYRELFMILLNGLLVTVLIGVSQLQSNQASDSQYQTSLHLIEMVSSDLHVDKTKVYINASVATDRVIVKVGDQFYRVISGSEPDTHLLEKMDLHEAAVELVEVEK
ncbi:MULTISPECIES: DUF3290 family protein [unclassified Streptococcus]|uniref:DUF3290 family protein n=1 Tax=unclassified Streptococcus TaxID=2608887 RepID=UPI0010718C3D|nr:MULTISPECIES: DUF3290 family protein [unclassified Streptococcus]MBF0787464.1 DUF3290 family protein [Streptococcus sp. 19428wC2_LYSM12]MCQ9212024.1 DUF3290 domain-containing protein [Streptococcus sp. B01]MCQ9213353.1 DUF3290 domain-containing protein [Streptococcus sp. O1]TFV05548.1 DUF3290 domain-containing protein [Streptococcus sp. LYSM12]